MQSLQRPARLDQLGGQPVEQPGMRGPDAAVAEVARGRNESLPEVMLPDGMRHDPRVTCLREGRILGTGGGVRHALPSLGAEPFFLCNADAFWRDPAFWDKLKSEQ